MLIAFLFVNMRTGQVLFTTPVLDRNFGLYVTNVCGLVTDLPAVINLDDHLK